MKKTLALILALVLCFALAAPAMAAGPHVEVSKQTLMVDGVVYKCDKYNIDDNNYFKLRDLAYLLSGTGSQFSVGWDASSGTVSIVTGEEYESIGKELLLGKDASGTAQKTAQTILINGEKVTDINVYNIGGSNYFRLRDLGDALGFDVDYNASTGTAIVKSHPKAYRVSKEVSTGSYDDYDYDDEGNAIEASKKTYKYKALEEYTYDKMGNTLTDHYVYEADGTTETDSTYTYTYDDRGNTLTGLWITADGYSRSYVNTYDENDNLIKAVYTDKDADGTTSETTITYTYNARGFCVKEVNEGPYMGSTVEYTYDSRNNVLSEVTTYSDGDKSVVKYTYDEAGNTLTEEYSGWDGSTSVSTYTYNDAGQTLSDKYESVYSYGADTVSYLYTYDDAGNCVKTVYKYEFDYGDDDKGEDGYIEVRTYDSNSRVLTDKYTKLDGTGSTTTFTYNAKGQVATVSYVTDIEGSRSWNDVYEYDKDGNLVKYTENWSDGEVNVTTYTYDSNGNLTRQAKDDLYVYTMEYVKIG